MVVLYQCSDLRRHLGSIPAHDQRLADRPETKQLAGRVTW